MVTQSERHSPAPQIYTDLDLEMKSDDSLLLCNEENLARTVEIYLLKGEYTSSMELEET